jgi:hypothetical protein
MGLDMYLKAEVYLSGYGHSGAASRKAYDRLLKTAGLDKVADADSPSAIVSTTVIYWRKANQIHNWFVQNVQDGKDDCGSYYVDRDQLIQLRDTCRRVLEATKLSPGLVKNGDVMTKDGWSPILEEGGIIVDSSVAESLLPNQSGFFFGSTDYDEWYIRDLEHTANEIDRVLEHLPKGADLSYKSSW